ncbi:MAG: DUF6518 family protein [Lachnospiraceae bacterium]|nr:DUF6518 family protein [Lachnospiraceae bacterium]
MKDRIDKALSDIRKPEEELSMGSKILISVICAIAGIALGVMQKWLDSGAVNEMPYIFQRLDIGNYFGRFAIWILLGTILSVYASTPVRAAINSFVFFLSMVAGYYLYSNFVLGFLPRTYMMIWIAVAFVSPLPAFFCWYAKGKGIMAILISACILGVLFSQAFLITQGFYVTHLLEVITWLTGVVVLMRKPKEMALELGLSLVIAVVYQLFIPYWG